MSHSFSKEVIYGRSLYCIDNNGQEVIVAFEFLEGKKYLMIIFCNSSEDITGYHEPKFWDTLFNIVSDFDKKREFVYRITAV